MGNKIIKRLVSDGMLIGVYVVLTYLSFSIGNIKIGLGPLATILTALLYGPVDGLIVSILGELLNQFIKFGITLTTPIWIIAPAIRGLFIGLISYLYKRKDRDLMDNKVMYFITLLIGALLTTLVNTLALYLDALIIGYPYTFVIIELFSRIGVGLLSSIIIGILLIPLYKGVRSIDYERN